MMVSKAVKDDKAEIRTRQNRQINQTPMPGLKLQT